MTGYAVRRYEQLDISRDDRARIAICSLQTLTDRLKENYSIDYLRPLGTIPRHTENGRFIKYNKFSSSVLRGNEAQLVGWKPH